MNRKLVSKSKFLSLVLRHDPGTIGLTLDANGWANVRELLAKAAEHGTAISEAELDEIVQINEKKRFDLDSALGRIRANQGHSIQVDLELEPVTPPKFLFHGTALRNSASISGEGLVKGKRHHVHLSRDVETAWQVGARHGEPMVFRVAAGEMHQAGFVFYISKNEVWLADHVPAGYLTVLSANENR